MLIDFETVTREIEKDAVLMFTLLMFLSGCIHLLAAEWARLRSLFKRTSDDSRGSRGRT
jgi:hypothetical protein